MKHFPVLLLVTLSFAAAAQQPEFARHANGLIYSEGTMGRLSTIVDSLNIRFRACDLSHPYFSLFQGNATWVELKTRGARDAVRRGITPESFRKKYARAVKAENVFIVKSYYTNYKGAAMIRYEGLPGQSKRPDFNVTNTGTSDRVSGWVVNDAETAALYLHSLEQTELPFAYARLVQYVDCMIDTTAQVMLPEAEENTSRRVDPDSKAGQFVAWAELFRGKPDFQEIDSVEEKGLDEDSLLRVYQAAFLAWDSARLHALDEKMKADSYYQRLLAEATQEVIASKQSDAAFEFYVMRYGSKADALTLMRSRRVIGFCSQDQSPRNHAMNICMAAAESAQWDIFLRSHLNIMNDRFERMSDGSYAWAKRKTYLRELEELGIPAVDLLIGTSLRVSNVSDNHYRGSINRVGRALADARDRDAVENRLLVMMQDDALDVYNRLLMAFVFSNYAHNLDDQTVKDAAQRKLEESMLTMPEAIQQVWKSREK